MCVWVCVCVCVYVFVYAPSLVYFPYVCVCVCVCVCARIDEKGVESVVVHLKINLKYVYNISQKT